MITSIIRYHTAIYYIMSITRDRFRPYWVSSGGCKKHSIINMLKKQICHWVQKNAIQNNMIQQYLYHGGHTQGHMSYMSYYATCYMLKKQTNLPLGAEKCNTKQYDTAIPISWGSHSRAHTHDMDNKLLASK